MAELDTQMTLEQVAQRYGVATDALTQMVQDGIIRAVKENDVEEPAVTVSTVAAAASIIKEEIKPEQFDHLRGQKIQVNEAAIENGVLQSTVSNWIDYGYIQVLGRRSQYVDIDSADICYVAAVFKRAKELTGSSIRAGWVLKRIID